MIGHPAISALVCVSLAYAMAIAIFPLIRRRDIFGVVAVASASVAIWACLFIIPREHLILRGVTALLNVDLFFRLIDFTRRIQRGTRFGWGRHSCLPCLPADRNVCPTDAEPTAVTWTEYCRFLIPFPMLLVVFGQKDRRLRPDQRRAADLLRLLLGSAGVALGFVLVFAAEKSELLQSSFLLDHITKIFIFILTVESLAQALCGLERVLGFDTTPIIDRTFLARTPAEFWRRWNNRINAWLYWNAFVPAGGRRAPIRGVWAACLLSAVLHEIAFTIATSRFTGYQFAFFLIQAPAVIASRPLERVARAWGTIGIAIAHTATALWMACTSTFFLHGVDLIFPFMYTSQPWLP